MERKHGKYALVQYCPVPERLEFLNIGVALVVPSIQYIGIKFAKGHSRIEKVFGKQPKPYLDAVKEGFANRLRLELGRAHSEGSFSDFARKRANDVRLSPLMPVMVDDPEADLKRLFVELVGDDEPSQREPRIRRKLREAFVQHRVEHYLDKAPEVELPEYGLKIHVPFGYQNGCYNLVDGMRLPSSVSDGLREAGKRAMEGSLIWKHFAGRPDRKRLVVVGDFHEQSNAFYHAVEDQMAEANVKLYRMDDLRPLLHDIEENASLHS